jgi:hypothetical protein
MADGKMRATSRHWEDPQGDFANEALEVRNADGREDIGRKMANPSGGDLPVEHYDPYKLGK